MNPFTDSAALMRELADALAQLLGADAIRCPFCPSCGTPPAIFVSPSQAMCGVDECDVLFWDPTASATVNLSDPGELVELTPEQARTPASSGAQLADDEARCAVCGDVFKLDPAGELVEHRHTLAVRRPE